MVDVQATAIDYRLAPIANETKVVLYPGLSGVGDAAEVLGLQQHLSQFFAVDSRRVVLGFSASSLFCEYLRCSYPPGSVVAIPSYSCPDILDALLQAGMHPVFLGTDQQGNLRESSLRFAQASGARCLLWPEYFGPVGRDAELLELADELALDVLLDDAQSFPGYPPVEAQRRTRWPTLLSFGKSKRLGCGGGGALIVSLEKAETLSGMRRSHAAPVPSPLPVLDDLRKLLQARGRRVVTEGPIDATHAAYALRALMRREEDEEIRARYYDQIAFAFHQGFSTMGIMPLGRNAYSSPSMAAFLIPEVKRFAFIYHLSMSGIQSTWYYVPLAIAFPEVKAPYQVGDEARLSSGIVIVPCQSRHTTDEINFVCEKICTFRS